MEIKNNLNAIFNSECKVLILGSFPGEKSNSEKRYYVGRGNRFWQVMTKLLEGDTCKEDKLISGELSQEEFLLFHHIALSDVFCEKVGEGSLDSNIKSFTLSPLQEIFAIKNDIAVFALGKKAQKHFNENFYPHFANYLPSTSGANRRVSDKELEELFKSALSPYIKLK